MDVRAFGSRTSAQKTLFSCAPSDGVKVFGSGRGPDIRPDVCGISRQETLSLGCFSVPDLGGEEADCPKETTSSQFSSTGVAV